ncbi:DUF309 domain-containing protein [Paenibacillus sacheonensis]|uniref:DUF309 domain-containing protein n=1 Tax=Paenibacillus sacheonensis TaxID=742054 RepID=A0A7X5BZ82_9BACL|nr:DUF309 domain-containing protein [Paenibacillus sacheonensis]MBM7563693.1 putative metal-dependent hydrolase [Paenibacillus sacheonensis]NBC67950.1 DUF309 domain-containing protein [Paenibacillus sacheonensis]
MTASHPYDEKFVHFVVLFNVDADYFECHEVMEELWLEEGRSTLYQGLLQAAVGLHHWRNDNFSGAVKLFSQAENKLAAYPDVTMGLDLKQLRADIAGSLNRLRAHPARSPSSAAAEEARAFEAFRLVVTDDALRSLAKALAEIPYEQRVHPEDD